MNILITGGSGLLASRLAEKMSHQHQITLVSRKKIRPLDDIKVQYIKSYSDIELNNQDIVIHAASPNSNDCRESSIVEEYLSHTKKIMSEASNQKIKKVIFTSSTRVYGNIAGNIDEENHCKGIDNYSKMKIRIENLLLSKEHHFMPIIVRISNSFGYPIFKDSNCWHLLAMYISMKAVTCNQIRLNSNGREYKDFVPMNYVVDNIHDILINNNEYNILNISSGTTTTVGKFALLLIKYAEKYFRKKIRLNLKESNENYDRYSILNNKLNIKFTNNYFDNEMISLLSYCKNHYQ